MRRKEKGESDKGREGKRSEERKGVKKRRKIENRGFLKLMIFL